MSLHMEIKDEVTEVKLKKGYDLRLVGAIRSYFITPVTCNEVAIIPDDYRGVVPRLDVKEGDNVMQGGVLFHDRKYADIVVTSPLTGIVKEIRRGDRRKIESIIIEKGEACEIKKFDLDNDAKQVLLESGLWACMRQRPYDIVPFPDVTPRDIFITTFDSSPLAPDYLLLIKGKEQYVQRGIDVLATMTEGNVYMGVKKGREVDFCNVIKIELEGPHPAGNAGVQISNVKPVNKGEVVWALDILTAARIGELFSTGYVSYDTVVAVTGARVLTPKYIRTIIGAPIADILANNIKVQKGEACIINGNVLSGKSSNLGDYLRYPYRHITVIDENDSPAEFMGWASLSLKKFSVYRSFFSWLNPNRKVNLDAKLNGGERAIVMSGEYDKMLPMDIYAEFLIKAILAFDVEKMEQLGIYEVAPEDFALCEFADTSKLELQRIVREGLDRLRREME